MSRAARTVPIRPSPTTPAATGTARSARERLRRNGSPSARPTCCRCRTITWCSRCRRFGDHLALAKRKAFAAYLAPLRKTEWVVYAKRPFGGPEPVLRYLSRYTHRVAIANSRLVALDDDRVAFKWKDYRADGPERAKVMTLAIDEFIRRFLIHVLPTGFHRIRHYGLFANGSRAENIARARQLLDVPPTKKNEPPDAGSADAGEPQILAHPCPCCGGRMIIIETFERGCSPRTQPTGVIRIDTS